MTMEDAMGAHNVQLFSPANLIMLKSGLSELEIEGYPTFVEISNSSNPCSIERLDGAHGRNHVIINLWYPSVTSFQRSIGTVDRTVTIRVFYPVIQFDAFSYDLAYVNFNKIIDDCIKVCLEKLSLSLDYADVVVSMADSVIGKCDTWIGTINISYVDKVC
jgi:hypothetical protein